MKLSDLYEVSLKQALEKFKLVNIEIHANENGDVFAVDLSYGKTEEKEKPLRYEGRF